MTSDHHLLTEFLRDPDDHQKRQVYADYFEERGDQRGEFLRAQEAVRATGPDAPGRLVLEERLSVARKGLDLEWLAQVEPERAHLLEGTRPVCTCMQVAHPSLRLHDEPQDTECDAWKKLLEIIERAIIDAPEDFAPLRTLSPRERMQIVTLPPSIGRLESVRNLVLYGSHLVRVPPELGELRTLQRFDPYTSYRLHWFPYELSRAGFASSTVSTRALYGNSKFRPHFPLLKSHVGPPLRRACSVCRAEFDDRGDFRVWISLRLGTDVLPLLVNACGEGCVERLPKPPDGYLQTAHRGGPAVVQPSERS